MYIYGVIRCVQSVLLVTFSPLYKLNPKEQNAPFSIIFFRYMIFQRHQKALLWSKGLDGSVYLQIKKKSIRDYSYLSSSVF